MLPTYQVFRTVQLMRAVAQREIDMVGLGPSIDFGRSLTDLLGFLTERTMRASICSYTSRISILRQRPAKHALA